MAETSAALSATLGIILAGGRARRLGGQDKSLLPLGGRPLLAHVIDRAKPQVAALALSANGDPARFADFGLPVLADAVPGFAGPLAGILAALDWAAARPGIACVASFACDTPFFPRDLVARLAAARGREHAAIASAAAAGRVHPVFALWPVEQRAALRRALEEEGLRKVDAWTARHPFARVEFPALPIDPFFNINTSADLARAEALLPAGNSTDNARRPGTESE
ncbi:MAG: molybdenum cofactor guanylyltransferase MobA [Stellaceae bacterium]